MISFTAYANKKFDMLARHGCVISRESVVDTVESMLNAEADTDSLFFAEKNDIRVACKKEAGIVRVITFYPLLSDGR